MSGATTTAHPSPSRPEIAAWLIITAGILLVFWKHLVPGIVAGIVFYVLLDGTARFLANRVSRSAVRPLALLVGATVGTALVTGAIALIMAIIRVQLRNIPALMNRMAETLESTRTLLISVGGYALFPDALRDAEDLKILVVNWLKAHAGVLGIATESVGMALVHVIMGVLLGTMVFLSHRRARELASGGPLARHLVTKINRLTHAFNQVVFAQVTISTLNTSLTAIYLLVILPIAGIHLPFPMTIIFITFVAGLIPVLGNLISNSVIVIISLGFSFGTAIASLVFLVVIHKLEYIVNSRIVGSRTGSDIGELLLAIIIGEAAFGIQGIILAPVIYTFAKRELKDWHMV